VPRNAFYDILIINILKQKSKKVFQEGENKDANMVNFCIFAA